MGRTLAVVQSNYIPWKGYFDLIDRADEFVLYDDVQYTKNDWRNRNRIKTSRGLKWLTISVDYRFSRHQTIRETRINDAGWVERHRRALRDSYSATAGFELYEETIDRLYTQVTTPWLSEVNRTIIKAICQLLDIDTRITTASEYRQDGDRLERLIQLCQQTGATTYLTDPSARNYLKEEPFADAGIEVQYIDYTGYPEYPQQFGRFEHGVSILDLLFNTGSEATDYFRSAPVRLTG